MVLHSFLHRDRRKQQQQLMQHYGLEPSFSAEESLPTIEEEEEEARDSSRVTRDSSRVPSEARESCLSGEACSPAPDLCGRLSVATGRASFVGDGEEEEDSTPLAARSPCPFLLNPGDHFEHGGPLPSSGEHGGPLPECGDELLPLFFVGAPTLEKNLGATASGLENDEEDNQQNPHPAGGRPTQVQDDLRPRALRRGGDQNLEHSLPHPPGRPHGLYSFIDPRVIPIGDVPYLVHDKIGTGAFAEVMRVELLVPRYTELIVSQPWTEGEDGHRRPPVRLRRSLPGCEDLSDEDVNDDELVRSGAYFALKILRLPSDNRAKAAELRDVHAYEISLLGQLR